MKNPNWIFDELILALDVYISNGRRVLGDHDPAVIELSLLLNKFWRSETNKLETLRNVNGVRMKIMNFMRLDPDYTQRGRVGLSRGSKLEEVVWREYANNPGTLSQAARAIRTCIANESLLAEGTSKYAFDEDIEAKEGRILTRIHLQRERNPCLVKAKKNDHLKKYGRLACEVCGFDFSTVYGERGDGFIECHHVFPLCELANTTKTSLSMLRLLCSNCHRMIHVKKPWITIEALKGAIEQKRTSISR